jgi:hypothetical protein
MSAARIIHPPLSGRDRRHYAHELRKAEHTYERLVQEAIRAQEVADRVIAEAQRLGCEAWNALQFIGGDEDPSPTIANAIRGGFELLEVQCRQCNHNEFVDLKLVIWPREKPVHTLRQVLYCARCEQRHGKKRRPALVGLCVREKPDPTAPAAAAR